MGGLASLVEPSRARGLKHDVLAVAYNTRVVEPSRARGLKPLGIHYSHVAGPSSPHGLAG